MLNGAFALLGRSLRIDAWSWSPHLARCGLMGAIYFSLCFTLLTEDRFGAPGWRFFQGIAYLDVTFMTLLGLGFFSTAITEEKEEDTLGLMLMAGISPLGILAGKSGGRLWQALLLVIVQYPFMLLAVTMGGVAESQISAMTMALLSYMVFLAGLGLLCSTIAQSSRKAGGLMIVGLLAYLVLPGIARQLSWFYAQNFLRQSGVYAEPNLGEALLAGIGDSCIVFRMETILATGFDQSPLSIQVISNFVAGLICGILSWSFFGLASVSPSAESASRGLIARQRAFFRFNAGRSWANPFAWKDFYFVSGGIGMILIRLAYYVTLGVVVMVWGLHRSIFGNPGGNSVEDYLILTSLSVAIDAGLVLARSMHDEVRGQTFASLMMLPRSSNAVVYAKFAGALLGWLPGPIIELVVTLNTDSGRSDFWSLATNEHYGGWALILLFVLVPHFAALTALYMRWGAVPLAIGLTIGVYLAIIAVLTPLRSSNDEILAMATIMMMGICGACHIGILLRVQSLGAK